MSGGHFNYAYSRTREFASDLRDELREGSDYSPKTTKALLTIAAQCEVTAKLMRAVEWLYSGDYGEESFEDAVREALKEPTK